MAKIVSVHSYRGGTGKSNLTANIAAAIAAEGKRVGIIDTDIQSPGIHILFGLDENSIRYTLNDYLWGRCTVEAAAYDLTKVLASSKADDQARLYLIPSSIKTGEIVQILREGYDVELLNKGFHNLTEQLKLDYLLIDTHPGLNEETLLSITISDCLLLLLRPDRQDFQGTAVTVDVARKLEIPQMLLVINKVLPTLDLSLLREQVETTYQAPVAGMLPLSVDVIQMASSDIFVLRHPEHPFSQEIHTIAEQLLS